MNSLTRWLTTLFVVAACWLLAVPAWAADDVVLAVAVEGESKEVGARELQVRVRRELEGRGFTVSTLNERPSFDESRHTWLRHQTTEAKAALGVFLWVRADTGAAELLVLDRVTGKSLVRVVPPAEDDSPIASTLALATAELLDASLIEIQMPHETKQPEVQPRAALPMPVIADAKPKRRLWQAELRLAGVWPIGLNAPFAAARLGLGVRPHERVLVELGSTLPLHPLTKDIDETTVRTLVFAFGPAFRVDVLPSRAPVQLEIRGGASLAPIRLNVDAPDELDPQSQTFWAGLGNAGLAVRKEWTHVYFVAEVGADIPFYSPVVRANDTVVHDFSGVWPRVDAGVGTRW